MDDWLGQRIIWTFEPEDEAYQLAEEITTFARDEDEALRAGYVHWMILLTISGVEHPYSAMIRKRLP